MLRWMKSSKWAALVACGLIAASAASLSAMAQEQLTEGKEYQRLKNVQAVESGGMKPRVNSPCYCGSGKKYKRCYNVKDQASNTLHDLPLKFHPAAFRVSSRCMPSWAGCATGWHAEPRRGVA